MTKIFVHATIIAAIVFVLAIVVPFILQWIDQASSVSISKKPEAAIALYTAFLALFTFALVIVSASQIYFLIRAERIANTTAQAAQKSAEVAKQTLIAADRAWIRIDRIEFANPGLFINNNGASGSVSFKITNIGKGPATNITLHAWLFAQKNGSPFAYEMQKQKCDEIRGQPLWAGFTLFPEDSFPNSIGISAWSSGVNINRIDMEEAANSSNDKKLVLLCVIGCIDYSFPSDPLRHHQTGFIYDVNKDGLFPISLDDGLVSSERLILRENGIGIGQYAD